MKIKFSILFLFVSYFVFSQTSKILTPSEIHHQIQKLNFLGTVLYVAAHPDDENTKLISYYANHVKARTAYLSLTRGDGGQNLIGSELGELLGVIRTQELLKARSIDKGEQYFSSAFDFGYSKVPEETFNIWDKDKVYQDVIFTIKKLRPDVIINRFDHRTPGTTHGHHTASAMLSVEAFKEVTHPNFIQSNKNFQAPKRIFLNTSWFFYGSEEKFNQIDKSHLIPIQANMFYKQFGKSNSEIAAESRTQHKCQGFGATGTRGDELEYLELIDGALLSSNNIFEGIDTSWNRIKEGKAIGKILHKIEKNFDFKNPSSHIPDLIKAYSLILNIEDEYWREYKSQEILSIIKECAGLYFHASTSVESTTINEPFSILVEAINRSESLFTLKSIKFLDNELIVNTSLNNNTPLFKNLVDVRLTGTTNYSTPYWLKNQRINKGMFSFDASQDVSLAEHNIIDSVVLKVDFKGTELIFKTPIFYKYNSPEKGEVNRVFQVLPDVTVSLDKTVYLFSGNDKKTIKARIKAHKDNVSGSVSLTQLDGWQVSPINQNFKIDLKNQEVEVEFTVTPSKDFVTNSISLIVDIDGRIINLNKIDIEYDHIPKQTVLKPSESKLVFLDPIVTKKKIGYVVGAEDEIPEGLSELGYEVVKLKANDLTKDNLKNFQTLIFGIRAYNIYPEIALKKSEFIEFMNSGGNVIVQYLTSGRSTFNLDKISPYSLEISRDRVTEEDAKISFINPEHKVLKFPYIITELDFENWVQERGLYFASKWDSNFESVFRMNDLGESPKDGALVIAKVGKGNFIYTGLSFFRQIPAGIPGAYKLLINLIEL